MDHKEADMIEQVTHAYRSSKFKRIGLRKHFLMRGHSQKKKKKRRKK